jgi:hypothetical protein
MPFNQQPIFRIFLSSMLSAPIAGNKMMDYPFAITTVPRLQHYL